MARPILIGVTGGIGAGKSTLVDAFVHRGAVPFSADAAVHELYRDPEVLAQVREHWGDGVITEGGEVDRSAIARIVFTDEHERRWLESLLHPLVAVAWLRFVEAQQQRPDPPRFVVAEVPLLFEAGLEDRYDAIVTVTAPHALRIARTEARGAGSTLVEGRAAAQLADADKASRSHFVLVNDASHDALDAFAEHVLEELSAG